MFCWRCGTEIADNARFCPQCGAGIEVIANNNPSYGYPQEGPVPYDNNAGYYPQERPVSYDHYTGYYPQPTPPVQPAGSKYSVFGILCIIACLITGISVFFPYVSVSLFGAKISQCLTDNSDWVAVLPVALIGMIFALFRKYIPVIIIGVLEVIFFLLENSNRFSDLDSYEISLMANDTGYYMFLFGSISMVLFAVLALSTKGKSR